ncbi:MAG TPA: hypothetical protein VF458_05650 [Ktedonobacteraceae bacterium]
MSEPLPSTPAQLALMAASNFLSLLEQFSGQELTEGGLAAQQMAVQSQLLVLNAEPGLAAHPGFLRYVQSLASTLAQLAAAFGKLDDPTYLTFLHMRAQMGQVD